MLVLSRKINQKLTLTIPPSTEERIVTLQIVDIRAEKCRLGIDASQEIDISRDDVVKTKEQKHASNPQSVTEAPVPCVVAPSTAGQAAGGKRCVGNACRRDCGGCG